MQKLPHKSEELSAHILSAGGFFFGVYFVSYGEVNSEHRLPPVHTDEKKILCASNMYWGPVALIWQGALAYFIRSPSGYIKTVHRLQGISGQLKCRVLPSVL